MPDVERRQQIFDFCIRLGAVRRIAENISDAGEELSHFLNERWGAKV